jgi:hypothetical protein
MLLSPFIFYLFFAFTSGSLLNQNFFLLELLTTHFLPGWRRGIHKVRQTVLEEISKVDGTRNKKIVCAAPTCRAGTSKKPAGSFTGFLADLEAKKWSP